MLLTRLLAVASLVAGTSRASSAERRGDNDFNRAKPVGTPAPVKADPPKPKYHMEFRHTEDFVEVGDLWLWDAIRNKAYDKSDMTGLEADNSYDVNGAEVRCIEFVPDGSAPEPKDLHVQIEHTGRWGAIEGVSGWDIRAQLIESLWEMVHKVSKEEGTLYLKCRHAGYCRWGTCDTKGAVCGFGTSMGCNCDEKSDSLLSGPCWDERPLLKVPSKMSLDIYNADGSLRADRIEVVVKSQNQAHNGDPLLCGGVGAVAEVMLSFLPRIEAWMDRSVKVVCE